MAEDERLTKAERREQARAERRRKEAEEAARAKRRRAVSIVVGLVITAFVVWVLWLAFAGGSGKIDEVQVVDPQAASDARAEAGCVPMEADLAGAATHFDPAEAPPADALYTLRPTASGPHFQPTANPGVYGNPLDERAVTHSMEHGAIAVWYDPDLIDGDAVGQMADWAEVLNASGFERGSGAGIYVSPFEGTFTSGKPIALRGWGVAIDCDAWQQVIGDAFVVDHYGTHGFAPEATIGQYPEDKLIFGPGAEETEEPNGRPAEVPEPGTDGTDPGDQTDEGGDATDDASPTDETTDETTDDASPEASPEPSPTTG